jgi:predicted metal-binding membrane protein
MTQQAQGSTPFTLVAFQQGKSLFVLLGIAVAAWAFLAWLAYDMDSELAQLTMPGSHQWTLANVAAIASMWAIMMAAMMLPSALPAILTFARLSLRARQPARAASFMAGYLLTWLAFSAFAILAQWGLQAAGLVDAMIVSRSAWLSAILLTIAGVYQFSGLKRACLAQCRSPVSLLLGAWRPGVTGALAMGTRYGLFCLGCCWMLMALLFVGGVMNLAWIAALTIVVAAEKLGPGGNRTARVLGLVLLGAGAFKLIALAS